MKVNKLTLNGPSYPGILRELSTKPPSALYTVGATLADLLERPSVAVVGNRNSTIYGERTTRELAKGLAEQGIVIISGLAYGVDAISHRAALEAGGYCIAVLPGPLDNILPAANRDLAEEILQNGGTLVSEYAAGEAAFKQNFVARNRIMSGLADAVLITEAGVKSGALHTSRYAIQQDKILMAVPGSIYSPNSAGVNNLIKSSSAACVTTVEDIMGIMGIQPHKTKPKDVKGRNQSEQALLNLMVKGVSAGDQLLEKSGLDTILFNQTLTMLELSCKIRPLGGNHWAIY
jgi:DNA processing protein